jgi:CubicO group peptidase (beta-lactamase class C family)
MARYETRGRAIMRRILTRMALSCGLIASAWAKDEERRAFPGRDWEEACPESRGVDPARFAEAIAYLQDHSGPDGVKQLVVVRDGRLIWAGTDAEEVHGVWSCTKSFTSPALGLLIDDGKCRLDTAAREFLPALAGSYPGATLRHFASMTSGYRAIGDEPRGGYTHGPSPTPFCPNPRPLFTPPGSHYAYWDPAMNQFANALTRENKLAVGSSGCARTPRGWVMIEEDEPDPLDG